MADPKNTKTSPNPPVLDPQNPPTAQPTPGQPGNSLVHPTAPVPGDDGEKATSSFSSMISNIANSQPGSVPPPPVGTPAPMPSAAAVAPQGGQAPAPAVTAPTSPGPASPAEVAAARDASFIQAFVAFAQGSNTEGYTTLAALHQVESADMPADLKQVAHDMSWALNTGMVPQAKTALETISHEDLAKLVNDAIKAKADTQEKVVAFLRKRFTLPQGFAGFPAGFPGFPTR